MKSTSVYDIIYIWDRQASRQVSFPNLLPITTKSEDTNGGVIIMFKTKICGGCNVNKDISNFNKRKASNDGLASQCKGCNKEYKRIYNENNKEKIAEGRRRHYKENKEDIITYQKEYYIANKEQIAEYKKRHARENKQHIAKYQMEYGKIYAVENKEKIQLRNRLYSQNNKELVNAKTQRYRARKKKLNYTLTTDKWLSILDDFNNSCSYCGTTEQKHIAEYNHALHQEHFIPLSKGGGYTHDNIIPSCVSCNSSKGNKNFFEWYPEHEHYSKERERFILEYLGYEKQTNTQQLSIL